MDEFLVPSHGLIYLMKKVCIYSSIPFVLQEKVATFDSKLSFVLFKVHFRFGFGFALFFIISDYGNHSICFQFDGVLTFWDFSNFLKKLIFGDLTCKSFLVYLTHYSTSS
jgi:hypothetical protein